MPLIDSAVDGSIAALIAGAGATVSALIGRRARRRQLEDAWKEQSDELVERAQREARKQAADEIRWLRSENARKDNVIVGKDAEIQRLNRLLNRQRGNGD